MNFVAGHGSGDDIAFHFNPRFDGWDKVVFNSYQGGKWGKEEKKRSMPFHKGTPFELVFLVLTEHYKVRAPVRGLPSLPPHPCPFYLTFFSSFLSIHSYYPQRAFCLILSSHSSVFL